MSGSPFFHALLLLGSAIVLVALLQRRHLHPFLALTVVATVFGLAVGFSAAFVGKSFGNGYSQMAYLPGLVIVAAGLVAGLAETTGASERLATSLGRWREGRRSAVTAAIVGSVAGIAASAAGAFALLAPLLTAVGGGAPRGRERAATTLALAISASHGVLLFSPLPIAAASILDAAWARVALLSLPVALVLVALGAALAWWLPARKPAAQEQTAQEQPAQEQSMSAPSKQAESAANRRGGSATVLLLATVVPLLMLMEQSLGDIPSEPLGGGTARELVLAFGRPLFLLLAGLGIMIAGHFRQSAKLLTDAAWTERVFGNVAGILLTIGAAGALQRLCQETGMAELLGERLLTWHAGSVGGVLVPFLVAAVIKTLQGSSLVAAIAAAGMVQPMLAPLGFGDENSRALATLAIGAGAMTVSHVNDEYFWLVCASAGFRPLRGFATLTLGTLLQGVAAVAMLLILSALCAQL